LSCKFTTKFPSHVDNTRDPNVSFTWPSNFATSIVTSKRVLRPFHYSTTPHSPKWQITQWSRKRSKTLKDTITWFTHLRVSNFRDRIEKKNLLLSIQTLTFHTRIAWIFSYLLLRYSVRSVPSKLPDQSKL
jgi:hypothetical protein